MKSKTKRIWMFSCAFSGILVYGLIGNYVLFPYFIHDECYFNNHDTGFLIETLFDFPAVNGYHPVPTKLGYLLFMIVGGYIGNRIDLKRDTIKKQTD